MEDIARGQVRLGVIDRWRDSRVLQTRQKVVKGLLAGSPKGYAPAYASRFLSALESDLIELAFRTPSDWIGDPAVDVGFVPAGPVGADLELSGEGTLGNLAVDCGPGQPGPGKNGLEADDPVWLSHGSAALCLPCLMASGTRQDRLRRRARGFHTSLYYGV